MSRGSIAIVTDSSADLGEVAARDGIVVVPLRIRFGAADYEDGIDLNSAEFYAKLRSERDLPQTAQPAPAAFAEVYRSLLAQGAAHVVSLHLSGKLSGTVNAARLAAAQVGGDRISVIDTGSVSGGLGMLALHAQRRAAQGGSLESVRALLADLTARLWLRATIPNLTYLARGGRIGQLRGLLGNVLRVVPILTLSDGEVKECAKVRTFGRAVDYMVEAMKSALSGSVGVWPPGSGVRCVVIHAIATELAQSIARRLHDVIPAQDMMICGVGPTVGTHAGPGAAGVFCLI